MTNESRTSSVDLGVVGLGHLGCVITAVWSQMGVSVRGVDPDESVVSNLSRGEPPIYEPRLAETLKSGLDQGMISFSTDFDRLSRCEFVFIAYDTIVGNDDASDLSEIKQAIGRLAPILLEGAVVVVSSQLPVGSAQVLRKQLRRIAPTAELVYSPENLRLGEALECYARPGQVIIGTDNLLAGEKVRNLFRPMRATFRSMGLASSEMVKHGINAFLAMSITFADQLSDLCISVGADYSAVADAIRGDVRIGRGAYLRAGMGFAGGTLGRDIRVLERLDRSGDQVAPIFGQVWSSNQQRIEVVLRTLAGELGNLAGRTITILGLTYKPGTSTLRRSRSIEVARSLLQVGATVRVYDPKADYVEDPIPRDLVVCASSFEAAQGSDAVVVLTEWPEFLSLDFGQLREAMEGNLILQATNFLSPAAGRIALAALRLRSVTGLPTKGAVESEDNLEGLPGSRSSSD